MAKMKKWKVVIEFSGKVTMDDINAKTSAEAEEVAMLQITPHGISARAGYDEVTVTEENP